MKKISYILSLLALLTFCACDPQSEYTTSPVDIYLTISDQMITAGTLTVDIEPEDDRVYYYCGIIEADDYHHTNSSNFMNYVLDSLDIEYKKWRSTLLKTDIDYVATFASHCLSYGVDSRTFAGLHPETTYMIYAFCVNPNTRTPMGKLWTTKVTTKAYHSSDLEFTYNIEHKADGVWMTIVPSSDDELYLWDIVDEADVEGKGLTPQGYVNQVSAIYHSTGQSPISSTRGFTSFNMTDMLDINQRYCLMVVGYDGDFTTELYHTDIMFDSDIEDVNHSAFEVLTLRSIE